MNGRDDQHIEETGLQALHITLLIKIVLLAKLRLIFCTDFLL